MSSPAKESLTTATTTTTAAATENDEAIAQALAREEQERMDATLARQIERQLAGAVAATAAATTAASASDNNNQNASSSRIRRLDPPAIVQGRNVSSSSSSTRPSSSSSSRSGGGHNGNGRTNCPGRHGLNEFRLSYAQRVRCDFCQRNLRQDEKAFGCLICDFDVCQACYERGRRSLSMTQTATTPASSSAGRFPFSSSSSAAAAAVRQPDTHMCIAPCVIGDVCVELMIDTGAQTSVMSLPLAQQLGLERRIDRSQQGIAAGVGRARIIGKIRHVACELGHVEFNMDFIVLDAPEKILLLGLDLMRRYKCIVDLERDVLVFGGQGGVEVHMLPADEQHMTLRNQLGCPMM